jgi:dTDP-4-dehydrorhamnose reductase
VAVTGPGGRLGRALTAALGDAPFTGPAGPLGWGRPDYDLDDPAAAARLVARDRPELVIHAAAWTDTEACARDKELCRRRNGKATGELAAVCAARGTDLVIVSTNEVFDGRRGDGRGYALDDTPNPINPYGASKLAGERAATEAFRGAASSLAIVRTAWLFGPPGNDFPAKILAAADRARLAGEPLRVVADETGSPTFAPDLAEAIVEIVGSGSIKGVHHVVNAGAVSRAGWAREVLRQSRVEVPMEEISAATWPRDSAAPAWAVLEPTPLPAGEPLRAWQAALADYIPSLIRPRQAGAR